MPHKLHLPQLARYTIHRIDARNWNLKIIKHRSSKRHLREKFPCPQGRRKL